MSAPLPLFSSPSPAEPDRLLAITLEEWSPLGGTVTLPLAPRRTVLVGRNGAGKSLLLEGCAAIFRTLVTPRTPRGPQRGRIELSASAQDRIVYEYAWKWDVEAPAPAYFAPRPSQIHWSERCWRSPGNREVWRVDDEVAHFGDTAMPVAAGTGLVNLNPLMNMPDEARRLRSLSFGSHWIGSGVPRSSSERGEIVLDRKSGEQISGRAADHRIVEMARTIGDWRSREPDLYAELIDLGRRVGILDRIDVKIYEDPSPDPEQRRDLAWISIDGVNIGLLSDGTLRILEMLLDLVDPSATLLLIEEPETSVHPGLLKRLLAEIDAYCLDRQVILCTHSLSVVDWAHPSDIRLVERNEGRTTVRGLNEHEVTDVATYLDEQGTLADYIYGRSDL